MPQLPTDEQALENLRQARRRVDRSQDFFIGLYQTPLAYALAPWLIRRHVRPNTVTVWMILSGILAAGLIALPSRIALILGAAVIQLFMLFDYADGAVARATGQLSTYGRELDSLAHLIGHPLMMVAFTLALVRLGEAPTLWTVALGGVYGMLEMCSRTLVEMDAVVALRAGAADAPSPVKPLSPKWWAKYIVDFFIIFPNFAMVFPWVLVVDAFAGTRVAIVYMALGAALTALMLLRSVLKRLKQFV